MSMNAVKRPRPFGTPKKNKGQQFAAKIAETGGPVEAQRKRIGATGSPKTLLNAATRF